MYARRFGVAALLFLGFFAFTLVSTGPATAQNAAEYLNADGTVNQAAVRAAIARGVGSEAIVTLLVTANPQQASQLATGVAQAAPAAQAAQIATAAARVVPAQAATIAGAVAQASPPGQASQIARSEERRVG